MPAFCFKFLYVIGKPVKCIPHKNSQFTKSFKNFFGPNLICIQLLIGLIPIVSQTYNM